MGYTGGRPSIRLRRTQGDPRIGSKANEVLTGNNSHFQQVC